VTYLAGLSAFWKPKCRGHRFNVDVGKLFSVIYVSSRFPHGNTPNVIECEPFQGDSCFICTTKNSFREGSGCKACSASTFMRHVDPLEATKRRITKPVRSSKSHVTSPFRHKNTVCHGLPFIQETVTNRWCKQNNPTFRLRTFLVPSGFPHGNTPNTCKFEPFHRATPAPRNTSSVVLLLIFL